MQIWKKCCFHHHKYGDFLLFFVSYHITLNVLFVSSKPKDIQRHTLDFEEHFSTIF